MPLVWEISDNDVVITQNFIKRYIKCDNAQKRFVDNVALPAPIVKKEIMWEVMFDCLLSSMQQSGPISPISKFLNTKPFPLPLSTCQSVQHLDSFVENTLLEHNCKRFRKQIGISSEKNFEFFFGNKWNEFKNILTPLCQARNRIPQMSDKINERIVSHWLNESFRGFGPKQSRNYIQLLGISRYEIPIDSRFVNWLIDCNFPIFINGNNLQEIERKRLNTLLSVPYWYDLILDKIQELSMRSNTLPCLLDGCVFGSFDVIE